jgi:two-component system, LytTR family, sensor kinase
MSGTTWRCSSSTTCLGCGPEATARVNRAPCAAKADLRSYPLYFLIWTIVGLFFFSQGLTHRLLQHDPAPWWHYLLSWLTGMYIWALLTPVLLWLGRRFAIERPHGTGRVALHLVLSLTFSVLQIALESVASHGLGIFPSLMKTSGSAFAFLLPMGIHGGVLTYWAVLGIQWGILYYRRYQERTRQALELELRASELQSQLMRAQLAALKMQLQPHFLFNTLNAIMVLVRQQKTKEAGTMLGHLGDLLRIVLQDVEAQEVSLHRELEYLRLYLSIEEARFPDRLRVQISAEDQVQDAAVPQMSLQPIVENAIRHGIGKSSAPGRIDISAARVNETLELRVEDDGPGFAPSAEGQGIGLANTRARLEHLYGERATLRIDKGQRGGTAVTMSLPYRPCP